MSRRLDADVALDLGLEPHQYYPHLIVRQFEREPETEYAAEMADMEDRGRELYELCRYDR